MKVKEKTFTRTIEKRFKMESYEVFKGRINDFVLSVGRENLINIETVETNEVKKAYRVRVWYWG